MITFKEFLAEQDQTPVSVRVLIERDCKKFIEESKRNGFLLRGVKGLSHAQAGAALDADGNEMEYATKNVRLDRKPLDFGRRWTTIIDDWFNDKFGIRARTQCLFATGEATSEKDLKFYGEPCVIFPIGDFEYVWSSHITDLYGSITSTNLGGAADGKAFTEEELQEKVTNYLKSKAYEKNTGMSEAVKMEHELMIKCSSYYAFPMMYKDDLKLALGFS